MHLANPMILSQPILRNILIHAKHKILTPLVHPILQKKRTFHVPLNQSATILANPAPMTRLTSQAHPTPRRLVNQAQITLHKLPIQPARLTLHNQTTRLAHPILITVPARLALELEVAMELFTLIPSTMQLCCLSRAAVPRPHTSLAPTEDMITIILRSITHIITTCILLQATLDISSLLTPPQPLLLPHLTANPQPPHTPNILLPPTLPRIANHTTHNTINPAQATPPAPQFLTLFQEALPSTVTRITPRMQHPLTHPQKRTPTAHPTLPAITSQAHTPQSNPFLITNPPIQLHNIPSPALQLGPTPQAVLMPAQATHPQIPTAMQGPQDLIQVPLPAMARRDHRKDPTQYLVEAIRLALQLGLIPMQLLRQRAGCILEDQPVAPTAELQTIRHLTTGLLRVPTATGALIRSTIRSLQIALRRRGMKRELQKSQKR